MWATIPEIAVLPLMHAAFNDAKCPDDVAVRSAATAALTRLVDAAAASLATGCGPVPSSLPTVSSNAGLLPVAMDCHL